MRIRILHTHVYMCLFPQRHRTVNAILKDELEGGVHALSIQAKTPTQWEKSAYAVAASPNCMGGAGK